MSKKLTEDEENVLQQVLIFLRIPDYVIDWVFSSGKAQLLNKYFLQRKDFVLKTKKDGDYQLLFSTVKISTGVDALKPMDKIKNLLKEEPIINDVPGELATHSVKKGRGKSKKAALNRVSLTCLVDSLDSEKLDKLALSQDVSVSHLVRLAIKGYLKNEHHV